MNSNNQKGWVGFSALIILLVFTAHAAGQKCGEYEVTTLQFPIDCEIGTVLTVGLSLNENGAVVGYYLCPIWQFFQGFLWTAEAGFEALDPPEGVVEVFPTDINDAGIICGSLYIWNVGYRGFVYEDGKWTILDPVVPNAGWSGANAINSAGVVVGQRSITENLNPQVAYMWSREGGFIHLDGLEKLSSATAINGNFITGWTANTGEWKDGFLWDKGEVTLLGPIPGGFSSIGNGINAYGMISGAGSIPMDGYQFGIPLAFKWQKGKFTIIEPIIGYDTSSLGDINDQGLVTGTSVNLDQPTDRHGYVWINGVTNDLNDFISGESGVLIETASGISDNGAIVANGDDGNDEIVAFLLTPINAPLGDLNDDCIVDISDLLILLAEWGEQNSPADFNNDGVVSTADLLILLANWG